MRNPTLVYSRSLRDLDRVREWLNTKEPYKCLVCECEYEIKKKKCCMCKNKNTIVYKNIFLKSMIWAFKRISKKYWLEDTTYLKILEEKGIVKDRKIVLLRR